MVPIPLFQQIPFLLQCGEILIKGVTWYVYLFNEFSHTRTVHIVDHLKHVESAFDRRERRTAVGHVHGASGERYKLPRINWCHTGP